MARVGIAIAAFNPGPYLGIALDSVLRQSMTDWECVVVDDGSTEDISWVATLDPRIRLIRQENTGSGPARNLAVSLMSAPLVAFLDSDDVWLSDYLATQTPVFDDPSIGLSSTEFEIIDASGNVMGPGFKGHNSTYEDLLSGCGLQTSTVMVRRNALEQVGGFRSLRMSQDWDLWLRIARAGTTLRANAGVHGQYRIHAANITRDYKNVLRYPRIVLSQHSHPNARIGIERMKQLSAYQAFDRARDGTVAFPERLAALAWAVRYEPRYVLTRLFRRAGRVTPADR